MHAPYQLIHAHRLDGGVAAIAVLDIGQFLHAPQLLGGRVKQLPRARLLRRIVDREADQLARGGQRLRAGPVELAAQRRVSAQAIAAAGGLGGGHQ